MEISQADEYHDDTRLVITYINNVMTSTRPYTADENAAADAALLRQRNATTLATDATAAIPTLLTSVTTIQAIVDKTSATIGPADTKDLARELKRLVRTVIRLTRLVANNLDSTDIGPA